jgi:hypothetical protein
VLAVGGWAPCGGDSCGVSAWLYWANHSLIQIPEDITGGHLLVLPSLSAVIGDEIRPKNPDLPRDLEVNLAYFDLNTKKLHHGWAACMSPVLSPARKWVVCRGRNGDVQKISLAGSALQTVAKSPVEIQNIYWVPYAYIYPKGVKFNSPLQFQFETYDKALKKNVLKMVSWRENP